MDGSTIKLLKLVQREVALIELICAMAEFRRCLTTSEALSLANDLISHRLVTKRWQKLALDRCSALTYSNV